MHVLRQASPKPCAMVPPRQAAAKRAQDSVVANALDKKRKTAWVRLQQCSQIARREEQRTDADRKQKMDARLRAEAAAMKDGGSEAVERGNDEIVRQLRQIGSDYKQHGQPKHRSYSKAAQAFGQLPAIRDVAHLHQLHQAGRLGSFDWDGGILKKVP